MASQGLVRPSRRALLLLGVTAPLAACSLLESDQPSDPTPAPPHPDDVIRDEVVAAERDLLARYAQVAAAHPQLADELAQFTERHERHVSALLATTPPATPDPTTEPGRQRTPESAESPEPATSDPPAPDDPDDAIHELREMESGAAQDRLDACLAIRDGTLARLLASIAACEASHDRLLQRVRS